MRIIGGRYQRKKFLPLPQNLSTRPTLDRVRETLFQRLENRQALQGARVLDAFAGTGALGLEALSRGADTVTFIENSLTIMDYLKHNVVHIVPPEDHDKIRFHQAASPA
ncbi:RsmD family RNA methyltransferase, partial [Alphaproteobacteria bacterium]|nr:RsmD family RNA methyltransferase [Alphaproteobacteria bacterium]